MIVNSASIDELVEAVEKQSGGIAQAARHTIVVIICKREERLTDLFQSINIPEWIQSLYEDKNNIIVPFMAVVDPK